MLSISKKLVKNVFQKILLRLVTVAKLWLDNHFFGEGWNVALRASATHVDVESDWYSTWRW